MQTVINKVEKKRLKTRRRQKSGLLKWSDQLYPPNSLVISLKTTLPEAGLLPLCGFVFAVLGALNPELVIQVLAQLPLLSDKVYLHMHGSYSLTNIRGLSRSTYHIFIHMSFKATYKGAPGYHSPVCINQALLCSTFLSDSQCPLLSRPPPAPCVTNPTSTESLNLRTG